jgi:hypothetical protein
MSDDVGRYNDELKTLYDNYKLSIEDIKQDDIQKIVNANEELKRELEIIREKLELNTYNIKVPLNTDMSDNTLGTVTVGNKDLLNEIKKEMGKKMELGSMIFKIKKEHSTNYIYAEFINKFRPYSSKNIAYLLLDYAISHKRYYTLAR